MHRLCKTFITNHGTKECMQGSQYSAMYTEWRDKNDQRDWTDWTKFSWWQLLLKGSRKNGNETRIGWMHLGGWWDLSLYNTANGTKELDEETLGCTVRHDYDHDITHHSFPQHTLMMDLDTQSSWRHHTTHLFHTFHTRTHHYHFTFHSHIHTPTKQYSF